MAFWKALGDGIEDDPEQSDEGEEGLADGKEDSVLTDDKEKDSVLTDDKEKDSVLTDCKGESKD